MPGGDRTGPLGQGAMSGRGAGFCSGNRASGSAVNVGLRQGIGRRLGRGMGRGAGRGYFMNPEFFSENSETALLKEKVEELKKKIDKLSDK